MSQRARKGLATWLTDSATPIFVLDQRQIVLVFNRGCEELSGWSAGDVIGKKCELLSVVNPAQVEAVTSVLFPPKSVRDGQPLVVPVLMPQKEGLSTPVEIHFFPLPQPTSEGVQENLRILGLIGPRTYSGIELVPDELKRRFDLSLLLADLHESHGTTSLIAESPAMRRVAEQVGLATSNQVTIHIRGGRGVGKQYLARLIHYGSQSREQRFLPLNCQTLSHFELSRTLRRLFAEQTEPPAQAAIYLENVEYLPRDLQAELLEHLQNRSPYRWFSASGSQQLLHETESFIPELSFALTAITIELPLLKDRQDDLLLLATQMLLESNKHREGQVEGFADAVCEEFLTYEWPGNAQELNDVVHEAARHCEQELIQLEHLPVNFRIGRDKQSLRPARFSIGLEEALNDFERDKIIEALQASRGGKQSAAKLLRIPRTKLYRRMEALNIGDNFT